MSANKIGTHGGQSFEGGQHLLLVISEVAHQDIAVTQVGQVREGFGDLRWSADNERVRMETAITVGQDRVGDPPGVGRVDTHMDVAPDRGHAHPGQSSLTLHGLLDKSG